MGGIQTEPKAKEKYCQICAFPIPEEAMKCTHCDSFQSKTKRAFQFSSSILSLLIALFAVIGAFTPVVKKALEPGDSKFIIRFQAANAQGLHFLAINEGNKPGVVKAAQISTSSTTIPLKFASSSNNQSSVRLIEGGKMLLMNLTLAPKQEFHKELLEDATSTDDPCKVGIEVVNFKNAKNQTIPFDLKCRQLSNLF